MAQRLFGQLTANFHTDFDAGGEGVRPKVPKAIECPPPAPPTASRGTPYLKGEQEALKPSLDFPPRGVLGDPLPKRHPLEVFQVHLHGTERDGMVWNVQSRILHSSSDRHNA